MSEQPLLAVVGGSGLYSMPGLEEIEEHATDTPFGAPSAPVLVGSLEGRRVAFLARHGRHHTITPTEVNYRANIWALKSLGARFVLSVSACGSLREDYAPGDIVVPDQLFDFTHRRARSFFGEGFVVHVGAADPFCGPFSAQLQAACEAAGATVHPGGDYVTIEGPRFSTRAESNTFRSWGLSIIGMTTSPEAFLAREAELHYAVMAHVTDYDVWHEEPVSVEMVVRTLGKNTQLAQEAIRHLAADLETEQDCECERALANAIITDPKQAPKATLKKLDLLVGHYLKE
jgi:5'-methylthioadenosine phosphorylase